MVLILSVICTVLLVIVLTSEHKYYEEADIYNIETFEYNEGWGYQISRNGKVIIYQSCIPCIEGEKSFPNKKSAMNTGSLVVAKIKNYENPTVTIEELNTILN